MMKTACVGVCLGIFLHASVNIDEVNIIGQTDRERCHQLLSCVH